LDQDKASEANYGRSALELRRTQRPETMERQLERAKQGTGHERYLAGSEAKGAQSSNSTRAQNNTAQRPK